MHFVLEALDDTLMSELEGLIVTIKDKKVSNCSKQEIDKLFELTSKATGLKIEQINELIENNMSVINGTPYLDLTYTENSRVNKMIKDAMELEKESNEYFYGFK